MPIETDGSWPAVQVRSWAMGHLRLEAYAFSVMAPPNIPRYCPREAGYCTAGMAKIKVTHYRRMYGHEECEE